MRNESEAYRENALNAAELAAQAKDEPARKRYKRMEATWLALADEQDWLDGKVLSADKEKPRRNVLSEDST